MEREMEEVFERKVNCYLIFIFMRHLENDVKILGPSHDWGQEGSGFKVSSLNFV